jgi:hypothetical protein
VRVFSLGLVVYGRPRRICLDRLDAVQGGFLALVVLAGRDDLAVAGEQIEVEVSVLVRRCS